jgi:cytochrome P450
MKRYEALSGYLDRFITSVHARCMIGDDSALHPELVDMFLQFNKDVDKAMGLGLMLPPFLRFITKPIVERSYAKFRKIFIPMIKKRREDLHPSQDRPIDFMPFITSVVDNDERASDLVTISVWIGLRNLQSLVTSTLLDIVYTPGLAEKLRSSLTKATVSQLNTFDTDATKGTPWSLLRSSMFESLRLCGPITGPARIISSTEPLALASDPSLNLPPKEIASLSAYYSHRQPFNYEEATVFKPDRFVSHDPEIGSSRFISWGLKGPHLCPGRWFAQEVACMLVKELLIKYNFAPEGEIPDDQKYIYHAGVVTRREVPVLVTRL